MESEHKPGWYLITINYQSHQKVSDGMRLLCAETFSPLLESVTKNSATGVRRSSRVQLFPGYMFVKINPEVVHPSVIATMSGVKEFVKFGGDICLISDRTIDALKASMVIRPNRNVTRIELSGLSVPIVEAINNILILKDKLSRQVALMELIQKDAAFQKATNSRHTVLATVLEHPSINDKIN